MIVQIPDSTQLAVTARLGDERRSGVGSDSRCATAGWSVELGCGAEEAALTNHFLPYRPIVGLSVQQRRI